MPCPPCGVRGENLLSVRSLILPANASRLPLASRRRPIRIPDYAELPHAARDMLWEADEVIKKLISRIGQLSDAALNRVLPRPERAIPGIHHALTPLFRCPNAPIGLAAARNEYAVLKESARGLNDALSASNTASFAATISTIARQLTGVGEFRDREVCASPDRFGRYVIYPIPQQIFGQLNEISQALQFSPVRPRTFDVMISLVSITNCHPFADGNGRISRIIGNWLFDRNPDGGSFYVPFREIAIYSRGGYIIRIRQAEIHGDWTPLSEFLLASVKMWASMIDANVEFGK